MRQGQAKQAQQLARDPAWRGAAAYRAGDYAAAAQALQQALGGDAAYNLGNTLAQQGRYKQAIEAYDTTPYAVTAQFSILGQPCRLCLFVPNAFIVRMNRALSEMTTEYASDYTDGPLSPLVRDVPLRLWAELTPREREVARLVGLGQPNKEIARLLVPPCGPRSVETHRANIFSKLQCANDNELGRWLAAHPWLG